MTGENREYKIIVPSAVFVGLLVVYISVKIWTVELLQTELLRAEGGC